MKILEAKRLNALLESSSDDLKGSLCIDTFRTPYFKWEDSMDWPSLSVLEAEASSSEQILAQLMLRIPGLLRGGNVLPEARPRRDEPNLHIVKRYNFEDSMYLLKIKILMTYMGGAIPGEIQEGSVQDRNPAFLSDRVYFQCRLFPVKGLQVEDGAIVDFEPEYYGPASGMKNTVGESHQTARWNVMLFDEMDFSDLEQDIRTQISAKPWKPGRLFNPFVIDHGTINWNAFHLKDIENLLPEFHRLWHHFLVGDSIPHEDQRFWDDYYESWRYRRFLSRGGNPHWEIERAPGWAQ